MTPSPDDGRTRGVEAPRAGDLGAVAELLQGLGRMGELEALERAALALAVHPAVVGFERAWWLGWDARCGVLEGIGRLEAGSLVASGGGWLEACVAPRLELVPLAREITLRPQRLSGAAAQAWNPGAAAAAPDVDMGLPWALAAHVGAVALRRGGRPWGLIVGTWETVPGDAWRAGLGQLAALCAQAALIQDQAREAKRRAQQSAALAQLVRAVGSAFNLSEVLQQTARLAAQATGARGSALWVRRAEDLRLEITNGVIGRRERTGRALQSLAEAVIAEGQPRAIDRVSEEGSLGPELAADLESVVVCPLRAYGRVLGVLGCYDRAAPHRSDAPGFAPGDVEFLSALADLAGVALDQAGRFEDLRRGEQQRRELGERLRRQEGLAWLGELALRMAGEARNPLASISAFARRLQRTLGEGDPNREYLEIILRESARLERLLGEQLDYAPSVAGTLQVENLNTVVQDALVGAGELLVRRRVRLVKKLAPDLPALLLDRERIRRVVANMLQSAVEAVSVGGRIRLESRRLGACVVLEIAHDGPRTPGELLEQVFVPFATQRAGGPGVGLGVAQQIVREHGGEIRVRSDAEWSAIFSLSLPVHENQDRRRSGPDRRHGREDRRARFPER